MREYGVRSNLPASLNRFVGRSNDLSRLEQLGSSSRLVTIVGPPGVGKTRLGREHARRTLAAGEAAGGVWFSDLSEAVVPEQLLDAVLSTLGKASDPGADATEREATLVRALGERDETLLVLDNFEQLLPGGRDLMQRLSAVNEHVRFVVTSRQALRIPGEVVFQLGALPLPSGADLDAVESSDSAILFFERARALSPGFSLRPEDAAVLAQLLTELDGLPLAIELCAARMRLLSPREMLERLGDRFSVLTTHPTTERSPEVTLFRSLASSWTALSANERDALTQASVFRGGFDLAAAEAVIRCDGLLDVLESLHDRSLLAVDAREPERRLGLLFCIRDFVEHEADPRALGEARARHAAHYLERLRAVGEVGASALLESERTNLLVAFDRLEKEPDRLALAVLFARHAGSMGYDARRAMLDRALGARPGTSAGVARALEARGDVLRFSGRIADSARDFGELARVATDLDDPRLAALSDAGLGNARAAEARFVEARELYERALHTHRSSGDRRAESRVISMLAATWFNQDEPEKARELLETALGIQREINDATGAAVGVTSLGIVAVALGDHAAARALLDEALTLTRAEKLFHWEGVALSYSALLTQDRGAAREAVGEHDRAIARIREIGVRRAEAVALGHHASAWLEQGEIERARACLEQALAIHRTTSPDHEGLVWADLGAIAALRGDTARAKDCFELAARALQKHERPAFVRVLALYQGLLGDTPPAVPDATYAPRSAELRSRIRVTQPIFASRGQPKLVIATEGLWFRAPGASETVKLHRRRPLARVLDALVHGRQRSPGGAVPIDTLIARGWPGERVLASAGAERVYAAIATLRKLGLRDVLLRQDDGYLLDPKIVLEVSETAG